MKVPPELSKLIDAAESQDLARYAAERRRAEAEAAKRRRILDLKMARYDEVWDNAEFLDRWRLDFLQTPETARLWRLLGQNARLPIFAGRLSPSRTRAPCVLARPRDPWARGPGTRPRGGGRRA